MTCYICLEGNCPIRTSCPCQLPVHRGCFLQELQIRQSITCTVCQHEYAYNNLPQRRTMWLIACLTALACGNVWLCCLVMCTYRSCTAPRQPVSVVVLRNTNDT